MRETTLVKANKELVGQAHFLGANVRRIVDLALEDYVRRNKCLIPEIKAVKGRSVDCDSSGIKNNSLEGMKANVKANESKGELAGDLQRGLQGLIDRLTAFPDGFYEIHDYKASQRLPPQQKLDMDRQLALYQLGARICDRFRGLP